MTLCFWLFQVQCGSVFVTSKDTVQKIKSTILATHVKHKKSSKHALALGTSFGHGKYGFSNPKVKLDLIWLVHVQVLINWLLSFYISLFLSLSLSLTYL